MTSDKKRLFIFVHDIGAAQIIKTIYTLLSARYDISLCAAATAQGYLRRFKSLAITATYTADDAIWQVKHINPHTLLLGTSNHNQIEPQLILFAKKHHIDTVSFVDQWQNYQQRFLYGEKYILPNKILLPDVKAKNELQQALGTDCKLQCVGHPYLAFIKSKRLTKRKPSNTLKLLFICEPISTSLTRQEIAKKYGYDEKSAINLLKKVCANLRIETTLTIKRHPKENKNKRHLTKERCVYLPLSHDDLQSYDMIIGMNSTLLIEAYLLGLNVITLQPNSEKHVDHCMLSRLNYIPRNTTQFDMLKAIKQRPTPNRRRLAFCNYAPFDFINAIEHQ